MLLINNMKLFGLVWLLLAALEFGDSKCVNTTDFKYDLPDVAQVMDYNTMCFDFTKRTCCSVNNFQNLAKRWSFQLLRISKIIGAGLELTGSCRRRITQMYCSSCDGDVGEGDFESICEGYCNQVYEQCKQDYFSIDMNGQIKICRQQDLICSKLEDIVAKENGKTVCELFSFKTGVGNCWNGQISALTKGKPAKKINNPQPNINKRPNSQKKKQYKKNENKRQATKGKKGQKSWWSYISPEILTYISLGLVVAIFFLWRWAVRRYRDWKRQIRNL